MHGVCTDETWKKPRDFKIEKRLQHSLINSGSFIPLPGTELTSSIWDEEHRVRLGNRQLAESKVNHGPIDGKVRVSSEQRLPVKC